MSQFFVDESQIHEGTVIIEGKDFNHIRNVLRMKPGDEISLIGRGDGAEYCCEIVSFDKNRVIAKLLFINEKDTELPVHVHLFQGIPKGDKMETVVQKMTELGAYEIIPVKTKRCIVKWDKTKAVSKRERLEGVAEAAAKQCRRTFVPMVHDVMNFDEALRTAQGMDLGIIPYELAKDMDRTREIFDGLYRTTHDEESCSITDIALFIGPEGGFEESEIEMARDAGIIPITLGRRILRTETAGMTVMSWILYQTEK